MNRRLGPLTILVVASLALAGCTASGSDNAASAPSGSGGVGSLPAAAQKIMDQPAYQSARWTYEVTDLKTGKVLLAKRPGELAFTASTRNSSPSAPSTTPWVRTPRSPPPFTPPARLPAAS